TAQGASERALNNSKAGRPRVLVATDIASRGIDVQEISRVFNYDLAEVAETDVHRGGRTGRNGASGTAVAFCDAEERQYLRQIERVTRSQLPVATLPANLEAPAPLSPEAAKAEAARAERPRHGGRGDSRGSHGSRPSRGESAHGRSEAPRGPRREHGERVEPARAYHNPAAERRFGGAPRGDRPAGR